jgi:hypothetical protein
MRMGRWAALSGWAIRAGLRLWSGGRLRALAGAPPIWSAWKWEARGAGAGFVQSGGVPHLRSHPRDCLRAIQSLPGPWCRGRGALKAAHQLLSPTGAAVTGVFERSTDLGGGSIGASWLGLQGYGADEAHRRARALDFDLGLSLLGVTPDGSTLVRDTFVTAERRPGKGPPPLRGAAGRAMSGLSPRTGGLQSRTGAPRRRCPGGGPAGLPGPWSSPNQSSG